MNELTQAIHDLPHAGLIPLGLLTVVGLVLWAAGRRVLRAAFATVGFLIGAGLGWMLLTRIAPDVSPWIGAAIVGLAVACVAAIVSRAAISIALAIVFAVAAPMAVLASHELRHGVLPEAAVATEDAEDGAAAASEDDLDTTWLEGDPASGVAGLAGPTTALSPETVETIKAAKDHIDELVEGIRAEWARTPESLRPLLLGSAIAGFLAGVLIGALVQGASTAIVTACGGSLLWLTTSRVIAIQLLGSLPSWLEFTTMVQLSVWGAVSLVGVIVQWRLRPDGGSKGED